MTTPAQSLAFYSSLLATTERASVYHLPHGAIDDLLAGAGAADCLVLRVDMSRACDKASMLDAVAKALRFPKWFGHNWDALNDCLLDMGWLPALGYVIILDQCDGIHARAEDDFVTLMQLFQAVADEWREDGKPFWCLVDMLADGIAWLPAIEPPGA
jgi:RNAse (barnase) inhibitor barstar